MFPENWPRYVLKLATGAGKTKVLSLLIAWCYFHKLYEPTLEDDDLRSYFLDDAFGPKPSGKTTDSKTDLGEIVREIDELAVFNDEAHHIHDERMAWFKSIQDILPDAASRSKLREHKSSLFHEKYDDYLKLGVEEWRKSYIEHEKLGKKAVLFVMVDDTRNCDDVGEHLQKICPELEDKVLVIHTKNNGDISEAASGKKKEELELLRKQSNEIDSWKSPYKAIVSVLMLKEGWDVKNVTVICGLRAYAAKSNILPEQTLGRGLRRMYFGSDVRETVSVMGTPAFIDFVESIQQEGVTLEHRPMGEGTQPQDSLIVEIDLPQKMARLKQWCADATAADGFPAAASPLFVLSAVYCPALDWRENFEFIAGFKRQLAKDSKESYFIQLADMLAFLFYAHTAHETGIAALPRRSPPELDQAFVTNCLDTLKPILNLKACASHPYGLVLIPSSRSSQ